MSDLSCEGLMTAYKELSKPYVCPFCKQTHERPGCVVLSEYYYKILKANIKEGEPNLSAIFGMKIEVSEFLPANLIVFVGVDEHGFPKILCAIDTNLKEKKEVEE